MRFLSHAGVDESFIADAENRLKDNPAWQGWVYEMKVIHKINSCIKEKSPFTLTVKGKGKDKGDVWSDLEFHSSECSEFFNCDEIPARQNFTKPRWFFPTKWNQGCFDVVYCSGSVLTFLQITKGDSHKYKLDILGPFIERFRHTRATTRFIVIAKKSDKFKVNPSDLIFSQSERNNS